MIVNQKHLFKILELPKHLQVTVTTLLKLGVATADDVAQVTGKVRAVESNYLNQLTYMKIVKKQRQERRMLFQVDLEALDW